MLCVAESAAMQSGSPDAVLAAIAQSSNEVTQGWMRLLASAPASAGAAPWLADLQRNSAKLGAMQARSEEHTSELQSHSDLVCRLLLEKKNQYISPTSYGRQQTLGVKPTRPSPTANGTQTAPH